MELTNLPPTESLSQAFGNEALIVSRDGSLATRLQGYLREDHGCEARMVGTYDEAEDQLGCDRLSSIFLDLRMDAPDASPIPLLKKLTKVGNPISVVAISEQGYGREWAQLADSTVHGYLKPPVSRDGLSHLSVARNETIPLQLLKDGPRTIQTNSVTFRTYTPHMYDMVDQLTRMAAHDVTLLLIGETGTGKTTIARMIHELSPRRNETLLTVACGALPPDLIESELFGHAKGSFTGADRNKAGKFEAANEGSLLLDEIDTLGPEQQAKLLRVIETGEYEPVGSNDTRHSRARLIVASNVDLKALMQRDEFRADLYYRLNVLEFIVPPLRERPRDIVPLTLGFVQEFCSQHGVSIRSVHPDFLQVLKEYHWPGNIRELKNHIRRAVLFCQSGELSPNDLAITQLQSGSTSDAGSATASTLSEKVAKTEREILEDALRANGSNRTATARALGISRVGLYKKMKKYGMIESRRRRA